MHGASVLLTEFFISREWIDAKDQDWCVYALETKLLAAIFFSAIAILTWIFGVLPQAAIFTVCFYFLRKRIGGYHAPRAWVCQLVSLGMVLCVTLLIGPALERILFSIVILVNVFTMIVSIATRPVYPPQTHFDGEVVAANYRKKNILILVIAAVQLGFGFYYPSVVIYTFLAVLTGLVSVYIELIRQKIREGYK